MNESLFQQPAFLRGAVIYEVNIRQYSAEGTFKGFMSQLPRLKDTGVSVLWLMPIHPIGVEKRKGSLGSYYSISDHCAVNPEFGTPQDLRELITKAHALGMKVILDWVANHTAWDHVWTRSNPEFFVRDAAGNFTAPFDWDDVIQVDHASSAEQAAMIDAMGYWITNFDVDGFRADLAHLTPLQFWLDARLKLSPLKKELIWLAETEDASYHRAFDISFTWHWMHATERFAKKEINLSECIAVLKNYRDDFPSNSLRLFFTSNHDENSWNGTEYEKYGNLAMAFAVFSFFYPDAVPLIYSGQELPNTRRLKFFDRDPIQWTTPMALQVFYAKLGEIRDAYMPFAAGVEFDESALSKNVLAYRIATEQGPLAVCLNLSELDISISIALKDVSGQYREIFSDEIVWLNEDFIFAAPAGGFKVFQKLLEVSG